MPPRSEPPTDDRLPEESNAIPWAVDCATEDTFLFASMTNISALGIFIRTTEPQPVGTVLRMHFAPGGSIAPFEMVGRVAWLNRLSAFGENLNPGMGVKFVDMQPDDRERLVASIRTIAYLRREPQPYNEN